MPQIKVNIEYSVYPADKNDQKVLMDSIRAAFKNSRIVDEIQRKFTAYGYSNGYIEANLRAYTNKNGELRIQDDLLKHPTVEETLCRTSLLHTPPTTRIRRNYEVNICTGVHYKTMTIRFRYVFVDPKSKLEPLIKAKGMLAILKGDINPIIYIPEEVL